MVSNASDHPSHVSVPLLKNGGRMTATLQETLRRSMRYVVTHLPLMSSMTASATMIKSPLGMGAYGSWRRKASLLFLSASCSVDSDCPRFSALFEMAIVSRFKNAFTRL